MIIIARVKLGHAINGSLDKDTSPHKAVSGDDSFHGGREREAPSQDHDVTSRGCYSDIQKKGKGFWFVTFSLSEILIIIYFCLFFLSPQPNGWVFIPWIVHVSLYLYQMND